MSKGKKSSKSKKTSKKINIPKKIKKGQITKTELKPVGMLTSEGKLKGTTPVESISGIGTVKGRHLRKEGIETVSDYKKSFTLFMKEKKAKVKVKPKPKVKVKAKQKAKLGYYVIKLDTGEVITKKLYESESEIKKMRGVRSGTHVYVKARSKVGAEKKFFDKLGTEFKPKVKPKPKKAVKPTVKKVKAPRKGNDYVIGELSEDFIKRPNFPSDWKNQEGKIMKSKLRKHANSVVEAEYGKDSEQAQKMRVATKKMNSKEIHELLESWVVNHPLEFPHDE